MADGIIPDGGLTRGLQWTLVNGDTELDAWRLLLFKNDITPTRLTVLADLVEPSWPGYARYPLMPDSWHFSEPVDGVATAVWGEDPVEFLNTFGPTETVFGCAFLDPLFSVLRYVQRFDPGDIRPIAAGESVLIVPRITRRGTPA